MKTNICRLITDMLDETADNFYGKTAVSDENKKYTFGELKEKSVRLATKLLKRGTFHKPVAVCFDKEADEIVAFLGCLYSGNFFAPIDPEMPMSRKESIFALLSPVAIITSEKYIDSFNDISNEVEILNYSEAVLCEPDMEGLKLIEKRMIDTDPAYVLFTSGSTGVPKGVVVSHKSVLSYVDWVQSTFSIDDRSILGNQTPFYFSMSVLDIYTTLKTGCELVIIPHKLFNTPDKLLDYIYDKKVNTIYWVPSALSMVANSGILEKKDVSFLKKILFAGEVMPNKQLNVWRRYNPNALYANLFGPTEVTDICTYYIVDRKFEDNDPLPIGVSCINTDAFLLDSNNRIIPSDSPDNIGELCVRGIQLAYGYYGNSLKTNETFVQNPTNSLYPEPIYRTGDLAKYNHLGELIYVGRKDFQIKVNGYRIELGEIETAVSAVDEIDSNCCIFNKKDQLILCVYSGDIEKNALRKKIREKLPRYMMPHKYIKVDEMPLNQNGKIDRTLLKSIYC